jgi:hypothetical protein
MAVTIGFLIWVWLDGQEYPCQLQADLAGHERILGRDVLNRLEMLFRGPTGEVIVKPRRWQSTPAAACAHGPASQRSTTAAIKVRHPPQTTRSDHRHLHAVDRR